MAYREPEERGRGRAPALNVLGEPLSMCGTNPMTGFWRDGCCNTGPEDRGVHTVCAIMTEEFLIFSKAAGNDLSRPRPESVFRACSRASAGVYAPPAGPRPLRRAPHRNSFWRRRISLRCASHRSMS